MLAGLPRSKAEFMARAVRDLLSDSITTLPDLVANGSDAALHFFFANLNSLRKDLAPALTQAYDGWVEHCRRDAIEALLPASERHWDGLAAQMLEVFRDDPDQLGHKLPQLAEANRF